MLTVGLLVGACAPGAGPAIDWTGVARVAGTVEVDSNPELDGESEALVSNVVKAGLNLTGEGKRMLLAADLGLAGRYFLGEDEELEGTGRLDPSLAASAIYRGKTYRLTGRARVQTSSTSFLRADELDLGPDFPQDIDVFTVSDEEATRISASLGAGLEVDLDPRNQIGFAVDADQISFTENIPELTETRTLRGRIGWEHAVSRTTDLAFSTGVRHFEADEDGRRSHTLDVEAGLKHLRTPRHVFRLRGGLTGVRTVEDTGGDPDFDLGFIGGAGLDYRLLGLSATLDLTQDVAPSSTEGELRSFTRLAGSLNYAVNSRQALGARLSYTRRAPLSGGDGGDTAQLLSLGPTYSHALTPDARLSLGYLFRLADDDAADELASGHRVFLTFEHDFNL